MNPLNRIATLAAAFGLALLGFASIPAGAAPLCAADETSLDEPNLCLYTYGCAGVAGAPDSTYRYVGVAYCDSPSECYVWENGQRTYIDNCSWHTRWDRIPQPDETRDLAVALANDVADRVIDTVTGLPGECYYAAEPGVCLGGYGCYGVAGHPDGPYRYVGLAYCENGAGCYVWENGQRIHSTCILQIIA